MIRMFVLALAVGFGASSFAAPVKAQERPVAAKTKKQAKAKPAASSAPAQPIAAPRERDLGAGSMGYAN